MTDMRLFHLRIQLYTAAQTLKGEDAAVFWALLEEVLSTKDAMQAVARESGEAQP